MFLPENVIFRGPRLSLDHFGQKAPESLVSQLQNGESTSLLPSFIVDFVDILKITQGQTRFFNGILGGVKRQTSRVAFNGPRQQCLTDTMKTQLSPRETCQPTR